MVLTKVAEELKEPDVPWQIELADPMKPPEVGFEQGEQTLSAIFVHVPTGVRFLGVISERMHIALQRPIAAGRIGLEPAAYLHGQVGGLLDRLHREIFGRVDHHGTLAAGPRDDRRAIFVVMAPARLALLTTTTRSAPQRLLPALLGLSLVAGGMREVIRFHRKPRHNYLSASGE